MNKLIIFGDSIFKGVTYSAERQRYCICNNNYEEKLSQNGIATENCSKMGATVDKIESIVCKKSASLDKNTVCLLEFGGNDCDFDWQNVSDFPETDHFPKTDSDLFISRYRSIVETIKSTGAEIIVSNIVPIDAEKYLSWISGNRSLSNILRYIGDASTLYRWQEYYNLTVERIASSENLPLIDVRKAFLLSRNYKSLLCQDGLHPTEEGHNVIGNAIYNGIVANCL